MIRTFIMPRSGAQVASSILGGDAIFKVFIESDGISTYTGMDVWLN